MAFVINSQTKAAAAFKGNFGIFGPILFKLCMQFIDHLEQLVSRAIAIKGQTKAVAGPR